MINQLTSLKKHTTIVADTGEIKEIENYRPQDATTNPSLVLKAAKLPKYHYLVDNAIEWAKQKSCNRIQQITDACDKLAVDIGGEILKIIPGHISTEIDARLSYDVNGSVRKALQLIEMYAESGIEEQRVLIKLAATWQGIQAASELKKKNIRCNLTLVFSFIQAKACAEAGVFLISPFVGRISDWYKDQNKKAYLPNEDPGVISVKKIYNYYKKLRYETLVMGASFRNINQIIELAGCDRLTISPNLLKILKENSGSVERKLRVPDMNNNDHPKHSISKVTESDFYWHHNQDTMAISKLSQGIYQFSQDQRKLEQLIGDLL